ncbi:hypothetical protein D3C76_1308110 [compost metagenome]
MTDHIHVYSSTGIQLQHIAIRQTHATPLTDGSVQISTPDGQQLLAQYPAARHQRSQRHAALEQRAAVMLRTSCRCLHGLSL